MRLAIATMLGLTVLAFAGVYVALHINPFALVMGVMFVVLTVAWYQTL